jgi:hypothetical protein
LPIYKKAYGVHRCSTLCGQMVQLLASEASHEGGSIEQFL